MQKGLSELALSSSPGAVRLCEKVSKEFSLTGGREGGRAGAIFGETSTRIRPKVPNYPRNTIPGKFLRRNSELGVTRFEGIAFERRRKYRFSKAVLRFSLALPSCFPRSIVPYRRNDGAFILLRIGEECFIVADKRTRVVHANGYCEKDGSFLRIILNSNLDGINKRRDLTLNLSSSRLLSFGVNLQMSGSLFKRECYTNNREIDIKLRLSIEHK